MKIQVLSDLHTETHMDGGKSFVKSLQSRPKTDLLVIAGDLTNQVNHQLAKTDVLHPLACDGLSSNVLYVLGNHDFWGSKPPWTIENNKTCVDLVTSPQILTYKNKRVLAGTMWFPPTKHKKTNDFTQIPNFEPWVYEQNAAFHRFLEENLRKGDIVVTHYAPSFNSVHPRFVGSPVNTCFVSDETELILERKPALWIHGHMHDSFDYMLGNTRVVCNPFGYRWEVNPKFDDSLVIKV